MPTLVLDRDAVRQLLDMSEVISAVEKAFRDIGQGRGNMPPKSYLAVPGGDFRAMPAAIPGAAGMKWVNVHPDNPRRNLPTVMGVVIYNDPATGYPLAVLDAADITAYRTGAAAALASRYLARKDAHRLGIIGAGRQAYAQVEAHRLLFDISSVSVYDTSPDKAGKLVAALPGLRAELRSLEETVDSDIVCTLTPSRAPLVRREWVRAGTHINAIGADADGKEELEPAVLWAARVVVDDLTQATAAGEINVPVTRGLFSPTDIYATLAELVTGTRPGRVDDTEITVFDATGVAIEDVAVAAVLYEKAKKRGGYPELDLVGAGPAT